MAIVYVLLVAHFVGDFLCQSDWMAINKSKSWLALWYHVCAYMFVICLSTGLVFGFRTDVPMLGAFLIVNFIAHFVQDAITSRINARLWFLPQVGGMVMSTKRIVQVEIKETRHWFFVAIGADQLLHYVTLFVTAGWWLR